MRLRSIALVLGLAVLAQTGCKSCHTSGTVPPPFPPVQTTPPPFVPAPAIAPAPAAAPAPATAPAVGAMLPATDPDCPSAQPSLLPAQASVPASFNRLTSWSR
ncbi:MAG TPA: hypothetical protein VMF69_11520 [Gemmataceae bacterium]|nr:hypothetical protein [Gemmataceae bacterium]